ncbi:hypothetical protein BJY04DRAFT_220637 [Aspergillus karnatakaensis]|uniref:uncharacterized protein n=1 Tax=Aspergillus karnatakaensis TaxID=1810916 RepID=UPI003CCDA383
MPYLEGYVAIFTRPTHPINHSAVPAMLTFEREHLVLPTYIKSRMGEDLLAAFDDCRLAAAKGFWSMRNINEERQKRFKFMCPTDDFARLAAHCTAIDRLVSWREDYTTADPTLAPTPKLPFGGIAINISRKAYEKWAAVYYQTLEAYINNEYQDHQLMKNNFEMKIDIAQNDGTLDKKDAFLLGFWFQEHFARSMKQWEDCIPLLGLPCYEDLVNELFWAFVDSVEGGEELVWEVYGMVV